MTGNSDVFAQFVTRCAQIVAEHNDEPSVLDGVSDALKGILGQPGWLPEAYIKPRDDRYAQYPLHIASDGSFSVVSFVWQPGQWTPIHDHTVWGVVGIHQGIERTEAISLANGKPEVTKTIDANVGEVGAFSPTIGDVHRVGNVSDSLAVSIHVYGADIGRVSRHVFDESDGHAKEFISGYEPLAPLLP